MKRKAILLLFNFCFLGDLLVAQVLEVTPKVGHVNSVVVITGSGFAKNETVVLDFDDHKGIKILECDASGAFSDKLTVPLSYYGEKIIQARGLRSGSVTVATFKIRPRITTISPKIAAVGDVLQVSGDGFKPKERIQLNIGRRPLLWTTASPLGTFTASIFVPSNPKGVHDVYAIGIEVPFEIVGDSFEVIEKLNPTKPGSGTVGCEVEVSGSGFPADELLTVHFGNVHSIATTTVNDVGDFSLKLVVPPVHYGTHLVALHAQQLNKTYVAEFFVKGKLTSCSPASGYVGTPIKIQGIGCIPHELVFVEFGSTSTIATTQATEAGSFLISFVADVQPGGEKAIIVRTHESKQQFKSTFTIKPRITKLIPPAGTVGSQVTVIGDGFKANEEIRVDLSPGGRDQASTKATQLGTFSVTFVVPQMEPGKLIVDVIGLRWPYTLERCEFEVIPEVIPKLE